ncbi:MAG: hypothetical protein JO236_06425, partial [Mycobacterium sp.]|nr:hypothetical protein [Mycobacterium sp.]
MGEQDNDRDNEPADDAGAEDRQEEKQPADKGDGESDRPLTEKPEPDEDDKKEAAKMMTAYEDRPTLVMPGSGKTIT